MSVSFAASISSVYASPRAEVIVTRGAEEVGVSGALECDATAFEQLADAGRLDDALALYRGPFLNGFYADFLRARSNLFLSPNGSPAYNPAIAGSQPCSTPSLSSESSMASSESRRTPSVTPHLDRTAQLR